MPIPKLRYQFIFLILALLLGTWSARTQLAEFIISSAMHRLGLTDITADVQQLNLDQSHIAQFKFSLLTENGLFKLNADDINISYKFEQLKQGRVESVVIESLALHYQGFEKAPGESRISRQTLEPLQIIVLLRQALREYIIANTLDINHITLDGESFGALHGKSLRLKAINDDSVISTELTLLDKSSTGKQAILRQLVISRFSQDTLQATLGLPQTPDTVPAELELSIHDTHIDGDYSVEPRLLADWLQPFAQINMIDGIQKVSGSLSVDFGNHEQIESIFTARSDNFTLDSYRAENIEIKLKTSNPITHLFQLTRLNNGSYVKASSFSHDNFSLADSRLNMDGELSTSTGAWQFDGSISTQSIDATYESQTLQLEDIAAQIAANQKDLKIDGAFSTTNVPGQFSFALEHDLIEEFGSLSVKPLKPVDLKADDSKLSRLLMPWPYPFDLLHGDIKLVANATWSSSSEFTLNTRVQIDNAGGHYGEIVFTGLSFDHRLAILPSIRSIKPGDINLMQLDSGVIASNISTRLSLETATRGSLPRIVAQNLYGEIFGGSFRGDEIELDLNRDKNRFEISAENIDLAAIVATQQLEGIEVTGRIDGTIPVTMNEQGIFIEHGAFINDVRAGTIRYIPTTGTEQLKQNPLTGIALDALRDFRYSHLSADVNFKPDGMLSVNLQLKGTSPELDTKRPVHLNINTEQNLLTLLKSLRYAESVGASIDQIVRKKYEESRSNSQDNQ